MVSNTIGNACSNYMLDFISPVVMMPLSLLQVALCVRGQTAADYTHYSVWVEGYHLITFGDVIPMTTGAIVVLHDRCTLRHC